MKFNNSREAITCTLLKHYRTLIVYGFKFTWLGIHKIYRVGLISCYTYITGPMVKLCTLSAVLIIITVMNIFIKPYKDMNTNRVAILSYMANICIAFITIMKLVMLVTFGCQINCTSHKHIVLWYLGKVENVLLIHIPSILVPTAYFYMGVQKCRRRVKKSKDLW